MPLPARTPVDPSSIRAVRLGHGANCSSIGSVVDTLFVTALLGGAVFAAVVASLATEPVEIVGGGKKPSGPAPEPSAPPSADEDRVP